MLWVSPDGLHSRVYSPNEVNMTDLKSLVSMIPLSSEPVVLAAAMVPANRRPKFAFVSTVEVLLKASRRALSAISISTCQRTKLMYRTSIPPYRILPLSTRSRQPITTKLWRWSEQFKAGMLIAQCGSPLR